MFKTLSLAAIITLTVLSNTPTAADGTIGQYINGSYRAGNTRVVFFAADFSGPFTVSNMRNAATNAKNWCVKNNRSAANKGSVKNSDANHNQSHRLASNRHAVLGMFNLDTGDFRYVGIRRIGNDKFQYLYPNGSSGTGSKFKHIRGTTNGFNTMIAVADDDRGGVLWRFEGPN